MKVTTITVSAGRLVPHPFTSYSNLKPQVSLTATLDDGEDANAAVKALQAQAEGLVEDHKNHLIADLMRLDEMARIDQEATRLQGLIETSQRRLEQIRSGQRPVPGQLVDAEWDHDGDADRGR